MSKKELEQELTRIANENFETLEKRKDLERHYSDALDFHDVAVWGLRLRSSPHTSSAGRADEGGNGQLKYTILSSP